MTEPEPTVMDRAAQAALDLAKDRPWSGITLLDIAAKAGVDFAQVYAVASHKRAVIDQVSARFDLAAIATAAAGQGEVHDRVFDALMARIEAMEPYRHPLIAIAADEGAAPMAPRIARTARALLESAGVDTSGIKGLARIGAMSAVWSRCVQVWRDDEGALNRTMAEIDKRLKEIRVYLSRVGAGF
jgi:hypothetical protein